MEKVSVNDDRYEVDADYGTYNIEAHHASLITYTKKKVRIMEMVDIKRDGDFLIYTVAGGLKNVKGRYVYLSGFGNKEFLIKNISGDEYNAEISIAVYKNLKGSRKSKFEYVRYIWFQQNIK